MTTCSSCSRTESEGKVYWRRGGPVVLVEEVSVAVHGSYTCTPHLQIGRRREIGSHMWSEKAPENQAKQYQIWDFRNIFIEFHPTQNRWYRTHCLLYISKNLSSQGTNHFHKRGLGEQILINLTTLSICERFSRLTISLLPNNDFERSGHGLTWDLNFRFFWRNWGKAWNVVGTDDVGAEICNRDFPNTK